MPNPPLPVTPASIAAARQRIAGHVRMTPVLTLPAGSLGLANPLSLKLELLQHAGSFKPRGAFNTLLSATVPVAGVAAASGGNHGAAVAYASRELGYPARIFVPTISSPAKVARIRDFGATVVQQGARYADALALCEAYQAESGALGVHAYDAWPTIEGQGTLGLEWLEQAESAGVLPETLLVASGGGGLVAGIATAVGARVRVIAVEPEGSRALHAAMAAGGPVDVAVDSIAADSLGARNVGTRVHAACAAGLDSVVLVPDEAIRAAMRLLWSDLRLATEPGGAAALAALMAGAYRPAADERVGVLVCGGNVDLARLAEWVA
jgi:threonine dehydratase